MKKYWRLVSYALPVVLVLILALPLVASAAGQPTATLSPQPTTLGQTTEKTSPTLYFMLAGACIILAGGLAIYMRYSK